MNNSIKKIVCYLLVIVGLTGCSVEKNTVAENNVTEEIVTELDASQETESETGEVIDINVSLEGLSLLEMKTYIDTHQALATAEEMDQMVIVYDQELRLKFDPLFKKFISPTYFKAINDTRDEQYVLHIDQIKDATIRKEVTDAVTMGYCFTMQEGSYYLAIDYKDIDCNYGASLTDKLEIYYQVKKDEQLKPVRVEEYLNLSFDELYNRGVLLESILKDTPDFAFRDDIKRMMSAYVDGLLSIDIFSGTIDYATGQVSQSTVRVYEGIIEEHTSLFVPAIEEMMAFLDTKEFILKFDDQSANEEVYTMRYKYMTDMPAMIDRVYAVETTSVE